MSTAVGVSERNGHARVVGQLVTLMREAREGERRDASTVLLSREDESMLRDVDGRQLGERAIAIARDGSIEEWRTLVRDTFRLRYGLMVVFDAAKTLVE